MDYKNAASTGPAVIAKVGIMHPSHLYIAGRKVGKFYKMPLCYNYAITGMLLSYYSDAIFARFQFHKFMRCFLIVDGGRRHTGRSASRHMGSGTLRHCRLG